MSDPKENQENPEENKEEEAVEGALDDAPDANDLADAVAEATGESPDSALPAAVQDAITDTEETGDVGTDTPDDAENVEELAEAVDGDAEAGSEDASGADDGDDTAAGADRPDLQDALAAAPLVASGVATPLTAAAVEAAEHDEQADDHDHEHDDEHDEDHGRRSLAARALTWLVLLLVGGGVALWGAPKVAPHLPNGLGPVKAWLMPGALESEARLAALETDVNARFEALPSPVGAEDVNTAVAEGIAEAEARFEASLQALADKVEAADSAEVEGRLSQIEARLEGLATQIETLTGLSDAAEGGLSEEQIAQLGTFSAAVEGLRAEIGALAEAQGGLSQRIDDVEVTVERKLEEAEAEIETARVEAEQVKNAAVARSSLTQIEAAFDSGDPFEGALEVLKANTDAEVSEALDAVAASGVVPEAQLRISFADAAHAAIRADLKARDTGSVGGRLTSFLQAQVATRSLTPQEGDSTDAILSRAEEALRNDNLPAAVDELKTLAEAPKDALSGWLGRAEARVAAESALAELRGVLAAEN